MTGAHSLTGASSMYRWSECPGSVRLSRGVKSTASSYAENGSDAHALGAMCLRGNYDATEFIGHELTEDGRQFTVDAEMAEAVNVYTDACNNLSSPGAIWTIEQKFDLSSVHPGCFGTGDCVIWDPKAKLLTVVDYKHGAGIPVNVKGNPQLRYYGLGALVTLGYPAKMVKLVIVQPRCEHADGPVRSEQIEAIDLLDFQADLRQYAEATEDPKAPLVPGHWCRFCPAAKTCPALKDKAQAVAKLEFSPVLSYDPEKLREALDAREVVKAWLKNLDEFAYAEAEAGRPAPGYKLVAKIGRRKWRDMEETSLALDFFLDHDGTEFYEEPKLKSPAQIEKLVGKGKIDSLCVMESSGHVLVPESDKRQPIKLTPALVFQPVKPKETV